MLFRLIHKNRLARNDLDVIVPITAIDPHGLHHRRPDEDFIIAVQRVDDDRQEVVFIRQQLAEIASRRQLVLQLELLQRDGIGRAQGQTGRRRRIAQTHQLQTIADAPRCDFIR